MSIHHTSQWDPAGTQHPEGGGCLPFDPADTRRSRLLDEGRRGAAGAGEAAVNVRT